MFISEFNPYGLYITSEGDFAYFLKHIDVTSIDKYVFISMYFLGNSPYKSSDYSGVRRYLQREPDNNFSSKVCKWILLGD